MIPLKFTAVKFRSRKAEWKFSSSCVMSFWDKSTMRFEPKNVHLHGIRAKTSHPIPSCRVLSLLCFGGWTKEGDLQSLKSSPTMQRIWPLSLDVQSCPIPLHHTLSLISCHTKLSVVPCPVPSCPISYPSLQSVWHLSLVSHVTSATCRTCLLICLA